MLTPDADRLWLSYSHIKMSYMAARSTGLSLCCYCPVRHSGTSLTSEAVRHTCSSWCHNGGMLCSLCGWLC